MICSRVRLLLCFVVYFLIPGFGGLVVWVYCGFAGLCWLLACSLCLVVSGVSVICLDCLVLG